MEDHIARIELMEKMKIDYLNRNNPIYNKGLTLPRGRGLPEKGGGLPENKNTGLPKFGRGLIEAELKKLDPLIRKIIEEDEDEEKKDEEIKTPSDRSPFVSPGPSSPRSGGSSALSSPHAGGEHKSGLYYEPVSPHFTPPGIIGIPSISPTRSEDIAYTTPEVEIMQIEQMMGAGAVPPLILPPPIVELERKEGITPSGEVKLREHKQSAEIPSPSLSSASSLSLSSAGTTPPESPEQSGHTLTIEDTKQMRNATQIADEYSRQFRDVNNPNTARSVKQHLFVSKDTGEIKSYKTISELARHLGMSSKTLNNKTKVASYLGSYTAIYNKGKAYGVYISGIKGIALPFVQPVMEKRERAEPPREFKRPYEPVRYAERERVEQAREFKRHAEPARYAERESARRLN